MLASPRVNSTPLFKQFVPVLVGIGGGRCCAAKVNGVLVACHDGVDRRVLPCPQTFEAELVLVIGDRTGNVRGEKLRCDLTDHAASVPQPAAPPHEPDDSTRRDTRNRATVPVTRSEVKWAVLDRLRHHPYNSALHI